MSDETLAILYVVGFGIVLAAVGIFIYKMKNPRLQTWLAAAVTLLLMFFYWVGRRSVG